MRLVMFVLALFLGVTSSAQAKVVTQRVEYKQGDAVLEGYLAWDDAVKGKRPAALIVHDWMGVGAQVEKKAEELAARGYVALAADIYGKGVRPTNAEEARAQATKYRADRALMRARARAGLDLLLANPNVDPAKVVALGYCFGGGVSLELARSGAPVWGVVSFHGNLDTPSAADARNIKGRVLVLHGADDPYVPADQIAAFEKEMRDAGVDWQMISYGGAVHAFTNPMAGNDPSKGAAYNERADKRSWRAFTDFVSEM